MCVIGNGMWGMCYTDLGIALGTLCALELKAEDLGIALGTLCALELKAEGNNASINLSTLSFTLGIKLDHVMHIMIYTLIDGWFHLVNFASYTTNKKILFVADQFNYDYDLIALWFSVIDIGLVWINFLNTYRRRNKGKLNQTSPIS